MCDREEEDGYMQDGGDSANPDEAAARIQSDKSAQSTDLSAGSRR